MRAHRPQRRAGFRVVERRVVAHVPEQILGVLEARVVHHALRHARGRGPARSRAARVGGPQKHLLLVVRGLVPRVRLGGHALRQPLNHPERLARRAQIKQPAVPRHQPAHGHAVLRSVLEPIRGDVVPSVRHALHVRVPVDGAPVHARRHPPRRVRRGARPSEGVAHPHDVHVRQQHRRPDGEELVQHAEFQPGRGVVVRGTGE